MKLALASFAGFAMSWGLLAGCSQPASDTPAATAEREAPPADEADSADATEDAEGSEEAEETPAPTQEAESAETAAEEPKPPTERELVLVVQQLYASGNFDEAEAQFAAAREAFPDSSQLAYLHDLAAAYLLRADRKQEAFDHLRTLTDRYLTMAAERDNAAELFGRQLGRLASLADEIDGPPSAEEILDDYAARAAALAPPAPYLTATITTQRAAIWAEAGRLDEARALADELHAAAAKALEETPDDGDAILRVADALDGRLLVETAAVADGDRQAAQAAVLDFLFAQVQARPEVRTIWSRFVNEHVMSARSLAYTDPEAAAAALARLDEFEKSSIAPRDDEELLTEWREQMPDSSLIDQIRGAIEESRKRFALIGTPAVYPDNADGWVGVDAALTSDQLRGKVVLLDFFAVWCGPCIATFPHLRAWHDEFGPEGLQVIGVTNYQSYDWDAEAGRSQRVDDLVPEAERAGMEKFAAHHELPYAIAFTPDRELQSHYLVSGIPHVVLIDRAGKVRLFRIGSGEQNAKDMEQAIKECIAETAPADADANEPADAAPPAAEPAASESAS